MAHGIARRGLARQGGFSFIELLVALALLSTAVFAHLALYGSLFVEGQLGQQYLRAHWFSADWIAQSQASAPPGSPLKSGFAKITSAPPSSFQQGCINGYCAQESFAEFAQTLLKCELGDYASDSVCQSLQRRELLPTSISSPSLPAGNMVSIQSPGHPSAVVTWWRDETRRWSLQVGRES